MKSKSIVILLSAALLVLSCGKKPFSTSGTTYTGVILEHICGDIVVETLGPAYVGQADWVDSNNNAYPILHHVFRVKNPCNFGVDGMPDTLHFQVVGPQVQNCALCMAALRYMPDSSYSIKYVP